MSKLNIVIPCAFGLEGVVARELKMLGYDNLKSENGSVSFWGDFRDVVRCNIRIRTGGRVLIKMAEFEVKDYDDLFDGTNKIPWEDFIPENGKMHVIGKTIKSVLASVSDNQAIVKKSIVEAMKRKYKKTKFSEDGPVYKIEIAILKDIATLTIDTTGDGLHKRGYRSEAGGAPLKETLAAAMVLLSRWRGDRFFVDPFCGSGTILIEAAMIALNIAPGKNRSFASESWGQIPEKIWSEEREKAIDDEKNLDIKLYGSDIDKRVFSIARENAARAEVEQYILFEKKAISEFDSKKQNGYIVTNPPYGLRSGSDTDLKKLYSDMGKLLGKLDNWSYFILTPYERIEREFRRKSDKKRKLYNGKIKCNLYQYFGSR